jgi:hypothetical protein
MAETTSRTGFGTTTGMGTGTGQGMGNLVKDRPEGPKPEHTEGYVARSIEQQTAKLPSDLFLWLAGGSILGSLMLQVAGRKEESTFVGQWAPTFLIFGLYNKLVKVAGSDPQTGHGLGRSGY